MKRAARWRVSAGQPSCGRLAAIVATMVAASVATMVSMTAVFPGRALAIGRDPGAQIAHRLEIVVVGPQPSRDELAVAVASLMAGDERIVVKENDARLDASGRDRSSPRASGLPGIRIELGEAGRVRIVALASERPPAIREIDVANPAPVAAEVVAQIVHETAHALLALEETYGHSDGEPRVPQMEDVESANASRSVPPPSSASDPVATIERRSPYNHESTRLALSISYVTRTILQSRNVFGVDVSNNGVGASLTLVMPDLKISPYVALMLEEIWITVNEPSISSSAVHPSNTSIRAMLGLACQLGRKVEIAVGAGGGIDRMSTEAPIFFRGTNWSVGARGMFRLSYLLPARGLEVLGAVTVDVNRQVDIGGSFISNTKTVQPGLMLGLGWRP